MLRAYALKAIQQAIAVTENSDRNLAISRYFQFPALGYFSKLRSLFSATVAIGFWGKVHGKERSQLAIQVVLF